MNNGFVKGMLFALLIVYVISPADFLPGPIDDALAILIYYIANKQNLGIGRLTKKDADIEVLDTDGKPI
jgi:hypothetical protein